ncbi:hypothetical protein E4U31_007502 [Claviceps sp. LM219 group G6]|nr:hypothetical protein E4U31_007502 [Claviceps sp. LM219 group G6]
MGHITQVATQIGYWSQAIIERKALNSSGRDDPSNQLPPIVPALNFRTAFLYVAHPMHPLITFQQRYDISNGHVRDLQKSSSQPREFVIPAPLLFKNDDNSAERALRQQLDQDQCRSPLAPREPIHPRLEMVHAAAAVTTSAQWT